MKHDKDLRPAGLRETRVGRLFELHRQDALQTGSGRSYDPTQTLRADVGLTLRDRAVQSLRPRPSEPPR